MAGYVFEWGWSFFVPGMEGKECRVLEVRVQPDVLTLPDGRYSLDIDEYTGLAYCQVSRDEVGQQELCLIDEDLTTMGHMLLFQQAANAAVMLLALCNCRA